jgi:predicted Zn-dependent protease
MHLFPALWSALLVAGAATAADAPPRATLAQDPGDPLLGALVEELGRSQQMLAAVKGEQPPYYLAYRLSDGALFGDTASFGALQNAVASGKEAGRSRILDVSVRVGSRALDSTHKVRGTHGFEMAGAGAESLPIEDDPGALKVGLWRATDRAYKAALRNFIKVKANRQVKVSEEDQADDFSQEAPSVSLRPRWAGTFDRAVWRERIKRLSSQFKGHPTILNSAVTVQASAGTVYFVDTEGARVREPRFTVSVIVAGSVRAADGMDLDLYEDVEATSPDGLPSEAELEKLAQSLITRLEALRTAPVIEPYTGPAIVKNRSAAVFFHEIFGHRVEGDRQKDADEGHTFTKKVGQRVAPDFITIYDDPTRARFGSIPLNGHYRFDDEGVVAQRAPVLEKGVLKGFLLSRSPIKGFPHSNGHGRAQPGQAPVSRQGNLFVESSRRLPFPKLRQKLIEEVKARGKPYGLVFEQISGGFTFTRTGGTPQAFKVIPLVVTRVYPDGRPDELVRGVDIVGTPLSSIERILATGDDDAVFNGFCGAESGFVPVSAVSPSLLIGEIEVERKAPGHDRSPLLPPPPLGETASLATPAKEIP